MEMSILEGHEDDFTEGMTENDYTQNKSNMGFRVKNNISKTPVSLGFKNSHGSSNQRRESQKSFKSSALNDSELLFDKPE